MSRDSQPRPQTEERDSVGRAIRRNLVPAKALDLAARGARCLATRGVEATWREAAFRVDLMLGRDPWQHRADLPLRRELHAQRTAKLPVMPLFSVVVPLYNTPLIYLKQMIRSVLGQSYRKLELVLVDASDRQHPEVGEFCRAVKDDRINYIRLAKTAASRPIPTLVLPRQKGIISRCSITTICCGPMRCMNWPRRSARPERISFTAMR